MGMTVPHIAWWMWDSHGLHVKHQAPSRRWLSGVEDDRFYGLGVQFNALSQRTPPPGPWVPSAPVINQRCWAASTAICQHQLLPTATRAPCGPQMPQGPRHTLSSPADCPSPPSGFQMQGPQQLPPIPRAPPLSSPQGLLHPQGLLMKAWGPGTRLEGPLLPQPGPRPSCPSSPSAGSYHILPQPCLYFIRPRIAF